MLARETTLFGRTYDLPFGFPPMGGTALAAYRGDLVLAKAAQDLNTVMIQSGAALTTMEDAAEGKRLKVGAGDHQALVFEERANPAPACKDHHVQIYVANFSGPYRKLQAAKAEMEESSQHQYRIYRIHDVDTGAPVFTLDHEVRSMTHPMYGRPLVNRNPDQNARDYRRGRDFFTWQTGE